MTHACDRLAHRIDGPCGVQLLRRAHSASDCAQPVVVGGRAALAAPDYAAFSHRRLGRCSAAKAKAALGAESCADGRACGGQCDRSHGAIPMRPCVVCHARTVDRSVRRGSCRLQRWECRAGCDESDRTFTRRASACAKEQCKRCSSSSSSASAGGSQRAMHRFVCLFAQLLRSTQ